jgi:hypothetical protein
MLLARQARTWGWPPFFVFRSVSGLDSLFLILQLSAPKHLL